MAPRMDLYFKAPRVLGCDLPALFGPLAPEEVLPKISELERATQHNTEASYAALRKTYVLMVRASRMAREPDTARAQC